MKITVNIDLTKLRDTAKAEVDFQAGEVRKQFITVIPGQDMVYLEKRTEAERITANPLINPALVPHLANEAELNNVGLLQMAATILTMEHQWKQISAIIEEKRLTAKKNVDAADSETAINAAKAVNWSLT